MKKLLNFLFRLNSLRIGIYLTILMVIVIYQRPMFLEALESKAYDLRFRIRGEQTGAPEIVLVAMDEKSVTKLGRWPWPRIYWAQFFKAINKYHPKMVALDVIFSEPDQNLNLQFLEKLKEYYLTQGSQGLAQKNREAVRLLDQELKRLSQDKGQAAEAEQVRKVKDALLGMEGKERDAFLAYVNDLEQQANTDQALADALAAADNEILGWIFYQTDTEAKQVSAAENLSRLEQLKPYAIKIVKYKYGSNAGTLAASKSNPPLRAGGVTPIFGFQVNLPIFARNISGTGYFSSVADSDGVLRSAALIAGWPFLEDLKKPEDYILFPSLALEALRIYAGNQDPVVVVNESGVESVRVGDYRVRVNEDGKMLINYQGNLNRFQLYSFYDVINDFAEQRKSGKFNPEQAFKDKIVLVGPTAVGIYDVWNTPFGTMPGLMSHANIIDNALHNRELYRPNWMWAFDILGIAALGILLSWIYPKIRPLYSAGLIAILVVGYSWFNYYLFNQLHYSLTLLYPTLSWVLIYMGITLYHYTMEEKEKRFIRNTFSLYLSQEVIEELCSHPDKLRLGGEDKRVTVFFSDIAGFTSISEKLPTEKLVHLLNQYLTEMSDIVLKNRGTVDKYIGDAVMAIFGAPFDYPDHARIACLSSLEMHRRLKELNQEWAAEGWPAINCRIGLNTGLVKVGNMGSARRMDYTVIGDEVNLASRLEGANKAYGTNLMISESTYQEAKDSVEVRELDLLAVVGKQKPVRVYQLLAKKGELDPKKKEVVEIYAKALELFRAKDFGQAVSLFKKALELDPADSPSKVYLDRSQAYLENPPPPDWDGVFRLTKK